MAHDVFVSYSSDDKPTADAVCATLESRGIRCWIAPRDVLPGVDWGAAIIDAINESKLMVLVYSASANDSQQIKREVERAVNRGVAVIPFRIEDVPMSKTLEYFISTPHWLDAITPPLQTHIERLAETTRLFLEQSGVTLATPPPARDGVHGAPAPQPITSSKDLAKGLGQWVTGGTGSPTLAELFFPRSDKIAHAALIAGGAVLIGILSQIKMGPVWLQPIAVLLVAAALGSKQGALSVGVYIGLGIIGIPVFGDFHSAWSDVEYRGPYAQHALGHLIGLVVGAFAVGWLVERRSWDRRIPTAALLGLVGILALYVPGRIWVELVALFMKQQRSEVALLPSIPMLVGTIVIVAGALPWAWGRLLQRSADDQAQASPSEPEPKAESPIV